MDRAIEQYANRKGIRKSTVERWLQLSGRDREALIEMATQLNIGDNHLRDLLEWAEDASHRQCATLCDTLRSERVEPIWRDPKLGRNDKIRRVKEELRRLRFPRLVRAEREIQQRIRTMGLKSEIQISVPPSLEGGFLTVQVRSTSRKDLKRLVGELGALLDRAEVEEIFQILRGDRV